MEPLAVILVALALGADAFSLALGLGMGGVRGRWAWTFVVVVGFFHVVMPCLGLYLGLFAGRLLGQATTLIGALVLATIGASMLWEAFREPRSESLGLRFLAAATGHYQVLGGLTALALLAGSVSLDAFSVGFGLGALQVNLPAAVFTMGSVAALMTAVGLLAGSWAGNWLGEKAEAAGGLVLIIIGVKLMLGG